MLFPLRNCGGNSAVNRITKSNDIRRIITLTYCYPRDQHGSLNLTILAVPGRMVFMEKPRITFFDTTLRDGEQAPGCSMGVYDKLRMARQLDELGVDVMEAGFPIASEDDFRAVQLIATQVRRPVIAGLARASEPDIRRAWAALEAARHPRIHVFLASSDLHLQCKLKITREQALEQAHRAVAYARSLCDDVEFSPEDATRSDIDFLCLFVQAAVDAGAT